MPSIAFSDLMTVIYVLVDDWYQLAMDSVPIPSESGLLAFLRANQADLFPTLPDQSQFNRHARRWAGFLEPLRQAWLASWSTVVHPQTILDTKPVPVIGYTRSKQRSDFGDHGSYGSCACRKLRYFGYKLVMLTTLDGVPVVYDLVPAHTDERIAAMVRHVTA